MQKTVEKLVLYTSLFLGSFLFFSFASASYNTEISAIVSNGHYITVNCQSYFSGLTGNCTAFWGKPSSFSTGYPTAFDLWPKTQASYGGSCSSMCSTFQNLDMNAIWGSVYENGQTAFFYFDKDNNPIGYVPIVSNSNGTITIGLAVPPEPVNGVCGSSNQLELSEMPTTGLCDSGTPHSYPFLGLIWQWSCDGINGGTTENCFAYATGDQNITPVCGDNNGQTFSNWGDVNTDLLSYCSVGLQTNNSYTSSGQSWRCTTLGISDYVDCSFTVSPTSYPTLPTETDCSSYSIPDQWFCEINNTLRSFFLPSQSKLNEFNETMNVLKNKAPFNYLSIAGASLGTLGNTITTKSLSITILGNTGNISLDEIYPLTNIIKIFSVVMISIAMFLWARNYITHFFK